MTASYSEINWNFYILVNETKLAFFGYNGEQKLKYAYSEENATELRDLFPGKYF